MKKILAAMVAAMVAGSVAAAPQYAIMSMATGTNVAATTSTTAISGYIDEIIMEIPAGTSVTGTVAVTATPLVGSAVTLASKEIGANQLVRIRVDGTDSAGSALTSDPPGRYLSVQDKLTFSVSGVNTTGLTWRVLVKYDDGK